MAEKGHDFLLHLSGLLCKNYLQLFLTRKRPPERLRQTQAVCVNNNGSTNQSRRFRVEFMKSDGSQKFDGLHS
jgi:hypothetical protein